MTPSQLVPLLLLLTALPACAGGSPTDDDRQQRQLTLQEQLVVHANQRFGVRLLQQLAEAEPQANLMISPLSVSMALGMTLNGAAGPTYAELRGTLGFEDIERGAINGAYRGLLDQLRLRDRKVTFTIANGIWHDHRFSAQPAFLDQARSYFDAVVRPLDFLSPGAPATINGWVSEATGGRIPELIGSIKQEDRMLLLNAMYFKAPWSAPFEKLGTRSGSFRRDDGRVVQAQFMSQDHSFPWYQGSDVQVVELPYGDSAYSMVLVAPRSGSVAALVRALTPDKLDGWVAELRTGRVMLTMPKFSFRYGGELKSSLRALGMNAAFTPFVADFSLINGTHPDLHVSSVIHKTFIAVDEEGTEAAAATAVTIGITSLPPSLTFDRPFLFVIRERESGAMLFAGVLNDPTAG